MTGHHKWITNKHKKAAPTEEPNATPPVAALTHDSQPSEVAVVTKPRAKRKRARRTKP